MHYDKRALKILIQDFGSTRGLAATHGHADGRGAAAAVLWGGQGGVLGRGGGAGVLCKGLQRGVLLMKEVSLSIMSHVLSFASLITAENPHICLMPDTLAPVTSVLHTRCAAHICCSSKRSCSSSDTAATCWTCSIRSSEMDEDTMAC
jgi:hypothetical protein